MEANKQVFDVSSGEVRVASGNNALLKSSGIRKLDRHLEAESLGVGNFLSKPYSAEELLPAVRKELDK